MSHMASKKVTAKRNRQSKLMTAVIRHNAVNAGKRVRQFATDDGLLDFLSKLPVKKMPAQLVADKSANGAVLRREWCETNGIPAVRVYDDGMMARRQGRPINANGWRPDNAVRVRLASLAGINAGHFHYTRCETNPVQLATAQSLNWDNGTPDDFHGADLVYIYRI